MIIANIITGRAVHSQYNTESPTGKLDLSIKGIIIPKNTTQEYGQNAIANNAPKKKLHQNHLDFSDSFSLSILLFHLK